MSIAYKVLQEVAEAGEAATAEMGNVTELVDEKEKMKDEIEVSIAKPGGEVEQSNDV